MNEIFKLRAKYKNENFYFYFNGEKFVSELPDGETEGKSSYSIDKIDARLDWQLEALIGGGWMTVDKELIK